MTERYWITALVNGDPRRVATLKSGGSTKPLTSGIELRLDDRVQTRGAHVELRSDKGLLMRFGPDSDFDYTMDEYGGDRSNPGRRPYLTVFGEVYKTRHYAKPMEIVACGGKYRTSCHIPCPTPFFAQNIDSERDVFFSFFGEVLIWEWDEQGKSFDIVTVQEGTKVVLRHDQTKPMRERYTVESVRTMSESEWDYIASGFMSGKRWVNTDDRGLTQTITG